jgi:DNA polymerase III subunit chi
METVLPKLLERVIGSGERAVVSARTPERLAHFDQTLWTYDADSFLAHGLDTAPHPEAQPILLSLTHQAINGAKIAVVLDDAWPETPSEFQRILYIFEADDEVQTAAARERWKQLKPTGYALTYWQQSATGGWEKRVST